MTTILSDQFAPSGRVLKRYGICYMTLHRWLQDPRMNFPRPVYFGRLRYWRVADLEAWERSQPRTQPRPPRTKAVEPARQQRNDAP